MNPWRTGERRIESAMDAAEADRLDRVIARLRSIENLRVHPFSDNERRRGGQARAAMDRAAGFPHARSLRLHVLQPYRLTHAQAVRAGKASAKAQRGKSREYWIEKGARGLAAQRASGRVGRPPSCECGSCRLCVRRRKDALRKRPAAPEGGSK